MSYTPKSWTEKVQIARHGDVIDANSQREASTIRQAIWRLRKSGQIRAWSTVHGKTKNGVTTFFFL